MQRLEFSGAVQSIYGSLGIKRTLLLADHRQSAKCERYFIRVRTPIKQKCVYPESYYKDGRILCSSTQWDSGIPHFQQV